MNTNASKNYRVEQNKKVIDTFFTVFAGVSFLIFAIIFSPFMRNEE